MQPWFCVRSQVFYMCHFRCNNPLVETSVSHFLIEKIEMQICHHLSKTQLLLGSTDKFEAKLRTQSPGCSQHSAIVPKKPLEKLTFQIDRRFLPICHLKILFELQKENISPAYHEYGITWKMLVYYFVIFLLNQWKKPASQWPWKIYDYVL